MGLVPPSRSLPPLAVVRPEIAEEALAVVDRRDLVPGDLSLGSNRRVRWRCRTCGQVWVATVASRARAGSGCPICARIVRGKSRAAVARGRQSAAERCPELVREFIGNLTRPNFGLDSVLPATRDRCRWRCAVCGFEYEATVANRVYGKGCRRCAGTARARFQARLRPGDISAAEAWPHLRPEFVANLTRPEVALVGMRRNCADRCRWRCAICGTTYEATLVNRGSKNSGCPRCAPARWAATRMRPKPGRSLADTDPTIATELVEDLDRPGRTADQMPSGTNDSCRWRCARGHVWVTTVAARTRQRSGCPRCSSSGQSRLELEVAGLLHAALDVPVDVDVVVQAGGRAWRVDIGIELPGGALLVDLDPAAWHQDVSRDARKSRALRDLPYVRVRPRTLPTLPVPGTVVHIDDPDGRAAAWTWVVALEPVLADLGGVLIAPDPETEGRVLARAAEQWQARTGAAPAVTALDVRPELADEFRSNSTRPGIGLSLLPPSSTDRCRWSCVACGHEWTATVGSRCGAGRNRGRGTNCPTCARSATAARSRARAYPGPGESLADLYPQVATEFVACLGDPHLGATTLRPQSNRRCRWRCPACDWFFDASPSLRVRGSGCPACGVARAARARRVPRPGRSLVEQHPELAQEFVECLARAGISPSGFAAGANVRARWCCQTCRHSWTATIASRSAGSGCPACGHARTGSVRATPRPGESLADLHPEIAAEWHGNVTHPGRAPRNLRANTHDRCRWRCGTCSHRWIAPVKNRTRNGTGCPACARRKSRTT